MSAGSGAAKSVVESKLVSGLNPLTDDKSLFRQWDDKLSNVLARLCPGYEWALDHMKECLDKGSGPEEELTLGAGAKVHEVGVC